jgi:hypothetical protein
MMKPEQDGPLSKIISLIANQRVQSELNIAKPQLRNVKDAFERVRQRFGPRVKELQKLPDLEKPRARPALMRELMAEVEDVLSEVMRPDQLRRFNQIRLQKEGFTAFLKESVRDELSLSEEQTSSLKVVIQEGMKSLASAEHGNPGGRIQRIEDLEERTTQGVMDVLTEAQTAKWKDMLGNTFDFGLSASNASGPGPTISRGPGFQGPDSSGPASSGPGGGPF